MLADGFGNHAMSFTGSNPQLVRQLHQELFDYLKKVGARFPVADPLYSADAENKYLEGVVKNRLPQLEQQRLKFLSKDFYPKILIQRITGGEAM